MPRAQSPERVLGPYPHNHGHGVNDPCWPSCAGKPWRIIRVKPVAGGGSCKVPLDYESKDDADKARKGIEVTIASTERTVAKVAEKWAEAVAENGASASHVSKCTKYIARLFPDAERLPLAELAKDSVCRAAYDNVRKTASRAPGGKPLSVDAHRNMLTYARMFCKWCMEAPRQYLEVSGFASVKGVGKRKKGATSKQQLTIDEGRIFLQVCRMAANDGDQGAVAAMITLLMGLRADTVANRTVRQVDDNCRKLWVDGKSEAGRMLKPIPAPLQPYFAQLIKGKDKDASIWDYSRNGAGRATGKILNALRVAHPSSLTAPQLAGETGVGVDVVHTILLRLARKGTVNRPGRGHYQHRPEVVTHALTMRRAPRTQAPNRSWVLKAVKRMCALAGVPIVTAQGNRGFNATLKTVGGMDAWLKTISMEHGHADTRVTREHYIHPEGYAQAEQDAVDRAMEAN